MAKDNLLVLRRIVNIQPLEEALVKLVKVNARVRLTVTGEDWVKAFEIALDRLAEKVVLWNGTTKKEREDNASAGSFLEQVYQDFVSGKVFGKKVSELEEISNQLAELSFPGFNWLSWGTRQELAKRVNQIRKMTYSLEDAESDFFGWELGTCFSRDCEPFIVTLIANLDFQAVSNPSVRVIQAESLVTGEVVLLTVGLVASTADVVFWGNPAKKQPELRGSSLIALKGEGTSYLPVLHITSKPGGYHYNTLEVGVVQVSYTMRPALAGDIKQIKKRSHN